jgi:hypothetical protein
LTSDIPNQSIPTKKNFSLHAKELILRKLKENNDSTKNHDFAAKLIRSIKIIAKTEIIDKIIKAT